MEALLLPVLLAVGALLALQAAANVQLSTAMGSPFGASSLQLAIGTALLAAAAAATGALGALDGLGSVPAGHLTGGLGSALYITAGIVLVPRLGATVAVGLFIAGQVGASLVLDQGGWLGVERDPLDAWAVAGAAAVVGGVVLVVWAQAGREALDAVTRTSPGLLALGLAAGAGLPVQGAVNAGLRDDLDEPLATGMVSFVVATLAVAAILGVLRGTGRAPRPSLGSLARLPWWAWLGGLCGAVYVTAVFSSITEIGAAPTVALTVAGQQLASVLIDRHGLLRLPRRAITRRRAAGVALLLAGVAAVQFG